MIMIITLLFTISCIYGDDARKSREQENALNINDNIEKLRKQALQLGKIGQLKEAVEVFQSILSKETGNHGAMANDVKLLNNAGVAQMKYGLKLLAESEKCFKKGLEVEPMYHKAAKNLKRVQRILKNRAMEASDKTSVSSTSTESVTKNLDNNYNAILLKKYFQNWLFDDEMKQKVKIAMGARKPIQIRNALQKDFADKIHRELYYSKSYYLREGYRSLYQFHFSAFYKTDEQEFKKHPNLSLLHNMLAGEYVLNWISDVSASSVDHLVTSASLYRPGDYVMPHTDVNYDAVTGRKRRVAYILHMASQWEPTFGGELIMMNPTTPIAPIYNAITLFPVTSSSFHFVAPVAHNVPYPKYKRLAVSGWFQTKKIDEAEYMESLGDDDHKNHPQFSIDGKLGTNIHITPHLNHEDLEKSLKQGPIYTDKDNKIVGNGGKWTECVGDNVNNKCHDGNLIEQDGNNFEFFEGQNENDIFLNKE